VSDPDLVAGMILSGLVDRVRACVGPDLEKIMGSAKKNRFDKSIMIYYLLILNSQYLKVVVLLGVRSRSCRGYGTVRALNLTGTEGYT
jgi:hypothetical protein